MPDLKTLHQAFAGDLDVGPAGRVDIVRPEVFWRSESELPGSVQADDRILHSRDFVRRCGETTSPPPRADRQDQADKQNNWFCDSHSSAPGGWILEKVNEVVNGFSIF
jgi:hypothetical protein